MRGPRVSRVTVALSFKQTVSLERNTHRVPRSFLFLLSGDTHRDRRNFVSENGRRPLYVMLTSAHLPAPMTIPNRQEMIGDQAGRAAARMQTKKATMVSSAATTETKGNDNARNLASAIDILGPKLSRGHYGSPCSNYQIVRYDALR